MSDRDRGGVNEWEIGGGSTGRPKDDLSDWILKPERPFIGKHVTADPPTETIESQAAELEPEVASEPDERPKRRSGPHRSKEERLRDRAIIARLYCRGYTQEQIANHINISQAAVCLDLAKIRESWVKSTLLDFNQKVAEELARIDAIEQEYWEAWRRSLKRREIVEQTLIPDKNNPGQTRVSQEVKTVEMRDGTAAYLQGVAWCVDRRIKLLGLDAPKKTDVTIKIRRMAEQAGLDPDEAVEEAVRLLREVSSR